MQLDFKKSWSGIVDLRPLNKYVEGHPFRMDTLQIILKQIPLNVYLEEIDLKSRIK
jgi:hypothetical protein